MDVKVFGFPESDEVFVVIADRANAGKLVTFDFHQAMKIGECSLQQKAGDAGEISCAFDQRTPATSSKVAGVRVPDSLAQEAISGFSVRMISLPICLLRFLK